MEKDNFNSFNLIENSQIYERDIQKICKPLFNNFPVTIFSYHLIKEKKIIKALGSDMSWLLSFNKSKALQTILNEKDLIDHDNKELHIYWPLYTADSLLIDASFDSLGNTYTILQKRDQFIEAWHLTSEKKSAITFFY